MPRKKASAFVGTDESYRVNAITAQITATLAGD
jgi:hypothetical protein